MISSLPFEAYVQGIGQDRNGNPIIAFYGIIIVFGACLSLFMANYRAHKDGFGMDFFNTIFLVAFPCGILGARIWYVIASWNLEFLPVFQRQGFWAGLGECFNFRGGGLAIQGGAIFGVLAGVLFAKYRRKGIELLQITDYAVPTILIGQGIGRWGNFFNQEVFGHFVLREAWDFVPGFILNNMQNGNEAMLSGVTVPSLPDGTPVIAAPLFLTESLMNLLFFFLIGYGLKALEGKHYKAGDETFAYFLAYGIIRLVMEPLRNPAFIMGESSSTSNLSRSQYRSFWMALAFLIVGVILLVLNHALRAYFAHRKKPSATLMSSPTETVTLEGGTKSEPEEEEILLAKAREKEEEKKNGQQHQ